MGIIVYVYKPIVLHQTSSPPAWVESHLRLVVPKQSLLRQSAGNEDKEQPRCPIAEKPQGTDVRYPELTHLLLPVYQVVLSELLCLAGPGFLLTLLEKDS